MPTFYRLPTASQGRRLHAIVGRLADRLNGDPERSRLALMEAVGSRITLTPDKSGNFLWAECGLEGVPLVAVLGVPEIMVAGLLHGYPQEEGAA